MQFMELEWMEFRIQFKSLKKINFQQFSPDFHSYPTHETCTFSNAPSIKGDSFDVSIGKAGDIQPIVHPWFSIIKLAKNNLWWDWEISKFDATSTSYWVMLSIQQQNCKL